MARPQKQTVEYFPHMVAGGKTLFILENKFGNDGYAFWFKLLELLGNSEGHYYDCNNSYDYEFLLAKTRVSEDIATNILNCLAELDAIDKELWQNKIIWSDNFIKNIADAYNRRKVELPQKPKLVNHNPINADINPTPTIVSDNINPQSILNESILDEIKEDESIVEKNIVGQTSPDRTPTAEIVDYLNQKAGTSYRHTSNKTRDLIKARLNEGFKLQDFLTVINKKVLEWQGTEFEKFIRPETLFSNKFEGYLNQRTTKPKSGLYNIRELYAELEGGEVIDQAGYD